MNSAYLIKDIKTTFEGGSNDAYPQWLTLFDGKIFFTAIDDSGNQELWSTDATEIGTKRVGDIGGLTSSDPMHLSASRYSLIFSAFTIEAGRELWYVNSGTQNLGELDEIRPGVSSSFPRDIKFLFEAPIFSALDNDGNRSLWRSDIGNEQFSIDHILPDNSLLTIFKDTIYFLANHQESGDALWKYNGSEFIKVFDYYPDSNDNTTVREIVPAGERLYFSASQVEQESDKLFFVGEGESEAQLIDSGESYDYLGPSDLIDVNGILYFTASTSYGRDLWRVRPESMTAELADPTNRSKGINRASDLTLSGNNIYYAGTYNFDKELWTYNLGTGSSSMVKEINESGDSLVRIDNQLTGFGNQLLFTAEDESHGEELWITDGTEAGTTRVTDINEGPRGSDINDIVILGDTAVFSAKSSEYGVELFGLNGEELETTQESILESYSSNIHSIAGKGKLKGTTDPDAFIFEIFDKFKKRNADKIIGYDSLQGDIIAIGQNAFPALSNDKEIIFATAKNKKELKLLSKEDNNIVYYEKKGHLYYDGNGSDKNWGNVDEGGLFAILKGRPELGADDIMLLPL